MLLPLDVPIYLCNNHQDRCSTMGVLKHYSSPKKMFYMKQLFFIALFISAGFSVQSATFTRHAAPDFVIVTDIVVYCTPDAYMSAQTVTVSVLDGNGNVQASASTTPGQTVSFARNDASRKVKCVYRMDSGQEYITVEDLVMG